MRPSNLRLCSLLLVILTAPVGWIHAAQVPISAAEVELTSDQETRAMRLNEQLKCPVCKNQSLAASSSFIAEEMKRNIRQMVAAGQSDEEILDFFVERYSEWILLAPPKQGVNWILYAVPPVFALVVAVALWRRFNRRNGAVPAAINAAATQSSGSEAAQVAQQWLEQQERL